MRPIATVDGLSMDKGTRPDGGRFPGSFGLALCWGIPLALIASVCQGLVGVFLDLGLLYPAIGYTLGRILRVTSPVLPCSQRQVIAVLLTYLAIALSPLIPFGNASGFEPRRMRNAALGLVIAFVPLMMKAGFLV